MGSLTVGPVRPDVDVVSHRLVHVSAQPDPASEWWTTSDVASYLGLKVATVSAYRTRGQMPEPDMTVGRTHVWRPDRIIAWHQGRKRVGVGGRPAARQD
jgi:predicted DNA-binding transcriptional regulator AlpA